MQTKDKIRLPAAWDNSAAYDLLQLDAGRAYIASQLGATVAPEHSFRSDRSNQDAGYYEVFADGSLWFINNAEDEVHSDYRDFVRDHLLPGLAAQSAGLCWTEEEYRESDDINSWLIDRMDKEMLLLYCDGDDQEARDLIGA